MSRTLKDPFMNLIDEALGRPDDPLTPSGRNYVEVGPHEEVVQYLRYSPYWEYSRRLGGSMDPVEMFVVTNQGRLALNHYLSRKEK